MKGMVFTEFLSFVGQSFGDDMVDDVIADCKLPNGGAYTAVGTYDHHEMQALVTAVSQRSGEGANVLLRSFGRHLCGRFSKGFPQFFADNFDLFDFLESVQNHIHVEVHKLYPDAELPSFDTHHRSKELLELNYRSCRPLAALAEGLILGAADHFSQAVNVAQQPMSDTTGSYVRLSIHRFG